MVHSKNGLILAGIVILILSLLFGFWGVYQTGKTSGLKEALHQSNLHKSEPFQDPRTTEGSSHVWGFSRYDHDRFWSMGPMDILCFLFFILCVSGCIFRFFGWIGLWDKPYHGDCHWSRSCCEEYREDDPLKSKPAK